MTHESATAALSAGDIDTPTDAMVGLALHDSDWRWCQDIYLRLLDHHEVDVRATAAICLGNLARIHADSTVTRTRLGDPEIGGTLEDAVAHIEQF
ncbi:hypothetical protein [Micromonospora sp. WMMD1155]|uniref:hypothetical protein n=1 Tax=Micromonospora sp. WMMD1155 TaxID=3016094 RepID=UPI002499BAC7|nr:hypothetical protein [Micromonospora sp. WMMD1155]WFE50782.1 hypothetical protein O7617_10800 [Micromonospora sp. WMMD1155]